MDLTLLYIFRSTKGQFFSRMARMFLDKESIDKYIVLRKLENVDVLYSLMDINNQRLDSIAQDQTFRVISMTSQFFISIILRLNVD